MCIVKKITVAVGYFGEGKGGVECTCRDTDMTQTCGDTVCSATKKQQSPQKGCISITNSPIQSQETYRTTHSLPSSVHSDLTSPHQAQFSRNWTDQNK